MSWDYRIEADAGEDIEAAVMAKHAAHIARYPGVSQEHAIAATPSVAKAATLAAAEAAKLEPGPVVVEVAGPNHYDHDIEITATVTPVTG